ncbi:Zinc/iron permease [Parathielavia appendiculata]|uniref:Zinc/iron permease n=1 Tax=Parathielavia appendiculata TaxID=2587402 RepID=A0AAN6TZN5_9PEZI|nr:Zinc/iron permease [Parathielavia appendiculata]
MAGLIFLIATSVVMAVASFLAGALPLSFSLSQSQLRLIASLGSGLLVGSCLIVILPEGIEALAASVDHSRNPAQHGSQTHSDHISARAEEHGRENLELPAFNIGFALVIGFALMFLIDRLPRHATERFQTAPTSRHVSLDNLAGSGVSGDEESEGFLSSLTPSPKQTRSLATTTGLVIHAAADGIAMGASATTSNLNVGLIIFFAILVHKAPAAFGLTSILLKQGLSKRATRVHLMVFSLAAPAGALATYFLVSLIGGETMEGESAQWWTGMLLLFSAGTFLYVAMHAMQEENHSAGFDHHSSSNGYADSGVPSNRRPGKLQMRDTLATLVGFVLPLLTRFGHHHH